MIDRSIGSGLVTPGVLRQSNFRSKSWHSSRLVHFTLLFPIHFMIRKLGIPGQEHVTPGLKTVLRSRQGISGCYNRTPTGLKMAGTYHLRLLSVGVTRSCRANWRPRLVFDSVAASGITSPNTA